MKGRGLIFDVDGVLTDTVPLHFAAWLRMFTEFGYHFDERLYREKVDGKSRLDGVRGVMSAAPEETVLRAGQIKQAYYLEMLESAELEPFEDAVRLIDRAARAGFRIAAASGSRNAPKVLEKIGLAGRMDVVVTGADVSRGKPAPDIFLAAADGLGLPARACVVIEDAETGVTAAKAGEFACVGIDRGASSSLLSGADLVVSSLDQVVLLELEKLVE